MSGIISPPCKSNSFGIVIVNEAFLCGCAATGEIEEKQTGQNQQK
jgi:hypothetical protein